jgi:multidrug efflux pump
MNIAAPFVARPVATTLLTLAIILAGLVAFRTLPVAPLPQVDFPTITVSAGLPGASPEVMAATVASPLERYLGRIAGVTEMTSRSSLGGTQITLQFELSRDINAAAVDVQAAINAARAQLPTSLPSNPTFRKVNPADQPILILALTSTVYSQGQLYDIASSVVAQKVSQIEGVGQATVGGSSLPAIRVSLNPQALNRLGIGIDQVRTAIGAVNVRRPKGFLEDLEHQWQIESNDQALRAADYLPIIVAWRNGAPVRLADVATVTESVQDIYNIGFWNGRPAVVVSINREPNANIIETVERVRELLPYLQASVPGAVEMDITSDRTLTIRSSLKEAERTLLISVLLVIGVVFLFLRDWRAALIPSVAVPVSLIGAFGVMYLAGYSLNNFSLMALIIAAGFVVDDAVVVLENVSRHVERGMEPVKAALLGTREVTFTVIAMSVSLVAVFIPVLLMGGYVGRLFREFAATLTAAIMISLVVSLTATPALCAKLLRRRPEGSVRRSRVFERLRRGYEASLAWSLRHSFIMVLILFATVGLNVYLYTQIPKGFVPEQDTGRMYAGIRGDQSSSFQATQPKIQQFVDIIRADPAVAQVTAVNWGNRNSVFVPITLKPLAERDVSAQQVAARLRPQFAKIPGASAWIGAGQDVRVGGRSSDSNYQYTLQSDDFNELRVWSRRLQRALETAPELVDVTSDQEQRGLQASLVVDRATAARLGVTMDAIDTTLNLAYGQAIASTLFGPRNQYRVIMEVDRRFAQGPENLEGLHVRSTTGEAVPLSAFARYEFSNAPLSVHHQGQFAASTISFGLPEGGSLSEALAAIERESARIGMPTSLFVSPEGTARAFREAMSNQPWLILAALVTLYIVLGMLYESYIHPLTILSTLPSAGVGALLALMLFKVEFSVIALIGVFLLIGIVKKNAIMMVDFALHAERHEGLSPREAILQAAVLRFRPIMMTTLAAALGALPLALGVGDGAELRRPLGIAIVGGLLMSQLLTLYTTPVVYLYLDRLGHWWQRRRGYAAVRAA